MDHVQLLVTEHVALMVVLAEGVQGASATTLAPSLVIVATSLRTSVRLVLAQW